MTTDRQAAISAIGAFVDDYVEAYALDDGECYHEPTEHERLLIEDAINGLVADGEFEELMAAPIIAERDALRAEVESLTQQLKTGESFHAVAVQQRDTAWREVESLRAEVDRLRTTIEHVAAIAHCGGWVGLSEDQTIVYVRVLTVGSMPRGTLNASVAALKEAVNAARAAQEGK